MNTLFDDGIEIDARSLKEDELTEALIEQPEWFIDNVCDRLNATPCGRRVLAAFARNAR